MFWRSRTITARSCISATDDMRRRVLCSNHVESTPSCIVYEDGSQYCFACGFSAPSNSAADEIERTPKYVEDVKETIKQIMALPKRDVRGLQLHCDDSSYYIIWQDGSYYKRRIVDAVSNSAKYRCPTGVRKPLFLLRQQRPNGLLLVVEGELNCLSAYESGANCDFWSPGGCGDFLSRQSIQHAPNLKAYERVGVVVDYDPAGIEALLKFRDMVRPYCSDLRLMPVKKDFNDVLQEEGKEALKKLIEEGMGLPL